MIYLGADHRGYQLKEKIKQWLSEWGYQYQDCGAFEYNKDDDYPDFVSKAAEKVSQDPENSRAIVLGGSGQGEAMVANRYKNVRAAVLGIPWIKFKSFKTWFLMGTGALGIAEGYLFNGLKEIVKLSREHNDANVLSIGASFLPEKVAKKLIKLWLETPFSGEERHKRRIEKIGAPIEVQPQNYEKN